MTDEQERLHYVKRARELDDLHQKSAPLRKRLGDRAPDFTKDEYESLIELNKKVSEVEKELHELDRGLTNFFK